MKILIDADGCPVVDLTVQLAREYQLECKILCDTAHYFAKEGAETIICAQGADSVDFKLVNMVQPNDIIVTQDYGLAAMCLAKRGRPINQNGMVYHELNIGSLLESRAMAQKVRKGGARLKGPSKRKSIQDRSFEVQLRQLIEKILAE